MLTQYGQFCPLAKASEIFANRWTPLVMRELMAGSHTFNDICRGVPLMSRAVLVTRLRELEHQGIIERRISVDGGGREYWLTPEGEAFRPVVGALANWGHVHARERIRPNDLDPSLLLWGLRRRTVISALPERKVVVRFEFAGVPLRCSKFRIMWLLLERSGVDVCAKDPGFEIDLIFRGKIADFVAVYLGHSLWCEVAGRSLIIEGNRELARRLPTWLKLDKVAGRDFPLVRPSA